jgi:hypothetical protein
MLNPAPRTTPDNTSTTNSTPKVHQNGIFIFAKKLFKLTFVLPINSCLKIVAN